MTPSTRIKQVLSVALVSILAATVMPSTVSAEPQYYDDSVVTVEVDLGEGPGDEVGCEGVATLELPDNTLRARFDGRDLGISDPTVIDYLLWEWGANYGPDGFTQGDLDEYLSYLVNVQNVQYTLEPPDATVDTLTSILYIHNDLGQYLSADTSQDSVIDGNDAPSFLTETRRTYSSDSFGVSFDANDCVDSNDVAMLFATRGYVKRLDVYDEWQAAEVDEESLSSAENLGSAYLSVDTNLFGGLISLPNRSAQYVGVYGDGEVGVAEYGDWSPVAFGDQGEAEMRAVINVFGSGASGKYQAKFYYQLDVNEEEYFEGLPFFGGFFGPYGPFGP